MLRRLGSTSQKVLELNQKYVFKRLNTNTEKFHEIHISVPPKSGSLLKEGSHEI